MKYLSLAGFEPMILPLVILMHHTLTKNLITPGFNKMCILPAVWNGSQDIIDLGKVHEIYVQLSASAYESLKKPKFAT